MSDAWDELREELGGRAGAEFLRRIRATKSGEVSLHVSRRRGQTVEKWVEPAERIDEPATMGAQSDPT